MLMVAYETVAYGSLLRIVAYEMFHVAGSEQNEKWKMKNEKWKMKNEKWKMKDECSSLMSHVACGMLSGDFRSAKNYLKNRNQHFHGPEILT